MAFLLWKVFFKILIYFLIYEIVNAAEITIIASFQELSESFGHDTFYLFKIVDRRI
jgi:hypothetical protein